MITSVALSLHGARLPPPTQKTVKKMQVLKRGVKIKITSVYDLKAVFVPPSLIVEYGSIKKREQGSACEPAWCYGQ